MARIVIWHCNTAMLVHAHTRSCSPDVESRQSQQELSLGAETVDVLRGVNLAVARGESVALTGNPAAARARCCT
jgi:hypothetical protein